MTQLLEYFDNVTDVLSRNELRQIMAGGDCGGGSNNCNCYCCTNEGGSPHDDCTWEGTISVTCSGSSHECCQGKCEPMITCPTGMYVGALCSC